MTSCADKWPILVGFYIGSTGTEATVNAGALFISTAAITAFTMVVSEVDLFSAVLMMFLLLIGLKVVLAF